MKKKVMATMMLAGALALAGCGDDESTPSNNVNNVNNANNVNNTNNANNANNVNNTNNANNTNNVQPTTFLVTIENRSNLTGLPTPVSPGVWSLSDEFIAAAGQSRRDGVEALAEDGMNSTLATTLESSSDAVGTFDAAPPGMTTTFEVSATPDSPTLNLAGMYVQSNDILLTNQMPIELFDTAGAAIETQDVTDLFTLIDAGTEADEAPGFGLQQAPRQAAADTGAEEGVVRPFESPTRALPHPAAIADITVTEDSGTFTVQVTNASADSGQLVTPIAPIFYAVHDDTFSFFTPGESASAGLETLAEDGSPMGLVNEHSGATGVSTAAAQAVIDGGQNPGPASPGETYTFEVTPGDTDGYLSFAFMVVQTNDAFVSTMGGPVALMSEDGSARAAADVEADINRRLAIFDAGTEANEVPGVGPNQAPRQAAADTGADDPDNTVRLYNDTTNDLAGELLGGFVSVEVITVGSDVVIAIENTSADTAFPGVITPIVWATHDDSASLFEVGLPASAGLESIAEDGVSTGLAGEISGAAGIGDSGVMNMRDGGETGPLMPGNGYTLTVTPSASAPLLSMTSMVVPSNDTFWAARDVVLFENGSLRDSGDIEADIIAAIAAYDAGTEANQAGAGGADQAPRQSGADTGAPEGDGTVRSAHDGIWVYPAETDSFLITVEAQ